MRQTGFAFTELGEGGFDGLGLSSRPTRPTLGCATIVMTNEKKNGGTWRPGPPFSSRRDRLLRGRLFDRRLFRHDRIPGAGTCRDIVLPTRRAELAVGTGALAEQRDADVFTGFHA